MAHSETRIAGKYRQEQIIKILSLLGYFQGWATKNKWFATTTTHKKRKQKKNTKQNDNQPKMENLWASGYYYKSAWFASQVKISRIKTT